MKKMIMAMLAFALAGSAFADTKTDTVRLYDATSIYEPVVGGGSLGGNSITLGNYYFSRSSYLTDNIYEMDISSFDFASIDSVKIVQEGGFAPTPNAKELDRDLGAIKISFYEGGTGNASADWNGTSLTLVKELSGIFAFFHALRNYRFRVLFCVSVDCVVIRNVAQILRRSAL